MDRVIDSTSVETSVTVRIEVRVRVSGYLGVVALVDDEAVDAVVVGQVVREHEGPW